MVVLPAAESPTTPRMIGRACTPSRCVRRVPVVVEDRAREDVLGLEGHQVRRASSVVAPLVQPARLAHARAVDRVADAAAVREARPHRPAARRSRAAPPRPRRELVGLLLEHQPGDRHQLVDVEVGEVDVVRDARPHARVRAEERLHAVAVAREHDDEVLALGLHHLEQDLDRLLAVVALVLGAVEVVGLVDEEHAAAGALEHLAWSSARCARRTARRGRRG